MKIRIYVLVILFSGSMFSTFSMIEDKKPEEEKRSFETGQIVVAYECTNALSDKPVFYKLEAYDKEFSTNDYEVWSYTEYKGEASLIACGVRLTLRELSKLQVPEEVRTVFSHKNCKRIALGTKLLGTVVSRDIFYGESQNKAFFAYCIKQS